MQRFAVVLTVKTEQDVLEETLTMPAEEVLRRQTPVKKPMQPYWHHEKALVTYLFLVGFREARYKLFESSTASLEKLGLRKPGDEYQLCHHFITTQRSRPFSTFSLISSVVIKRVA